jgi:hypothetical protein
MTVHSTLDVLAVSHHFHAAAFLQCRQPSNHRPQLEIALSPIVHYSTAGIGRDWRREGWAAQWPTLSQLCSTEGKKPMVDRQSLHNLIDELPETQLDAARRMLEDLRAEAVALDDDVLSPEELADIDEARDEIRRGDWATLDQIKSENGL